MEKDSKVYLEHILKAATEIADFINGFTEEDFLRDRKTQLAIIKNIEIMGEATKKISSHIRTTNPNIPWSEMAAMRDKLMHSYADVNYKTVWEVSMNEIPEVKTAIEKLLQGLN